MIIFIICPLPLSFLILEGQTAKREVGGGRKGVGDRGAGSGRGEICKMGEN
jgi:hypothetical protein